MQSRTSRFVLVALFALLGTACDKSGIYPLFAKTDVLVPCDANATTWLRSTATGTEILILGAADPTTASTAMETRCYSHIVIDHDSSTTFESGSYTLGANGSGTASYGVSYDFNYTSTGAILSRRGAQRTDLTTPRDVAISLAKAGEKLQATVGGVAGTYTNMYDLIGDLQMTNVTEAEDIFRLINLPLYSSQVRIPGFGGAGMVNYGTTTTFYSAIGGEEAGSLFTIKVENALRMPDTTIAFKAFQDMSGIVMDGPQRVLVSLKGDGDMSGIVNFVLRDGPGQESVAMRVALDYVNADIRNGVAGGGTFKVSTTMPTAASFDVPYTLAADVDLRRILPVE